MFKVWIEVVLTFLDLRSKFTTCKVLKIAEKNIYLHLSQASWRMDISTLVKIVFGRNDSRSLASSYELLWSIRIATPTSLFSLRHPCPFSPFAVPASSRTRDSVESLYIRLLSAKRFKHLKTQVRSIEHTYGTIMNACLFPVIRNFLFTDRTAQGANAQIRNCIAHYRGKESTFVTRFRLPKRSVCPSLQTYLSRRVFHEWKRSDA